jgi:hypothetical protein
MKSLSRLWNVISGAARRQAHAQWRAEWCRVRFDEAAIEIEVQERPVWCNRVAWGELLGVGMEPKGLLGPGLNLFIAREPGVVWVALDGSGASALQDELRRRGVPFRPLADLLRELDERLKRQARTLMEQRFPPTEWPIVQAELDSYTGDNIGRTQVAIVRLAEGQLQKVQELAAQARRGEGAIVSRDIAENMTSDEAGKAYRT